MVDFEEAESFEHYSRGAATLTLTDEVDKARFGRELPLSQEARQALDAIRPESGPIWLGTSG